MPVRVTLPDDLSAKSPAAALAGDSHGLLVFTDGGLAAWGNNSNGQLGDDGTLSRPTAAMVDAGGLNPAARFMFAAGGSGASHNLAVIGLPRSISVAATSLAMEAADAASADSDHDGFSDLIEYAFGLDQQADGSGQVPQPHLENGRHVFRFTEPAAASGVIYQAEWSATLRQDEWTAIPDSGSGAEHVFIIPSGPRIFARLKVIRE